MRKYLLTAAFIVAATLALQAQAPHWFVSFHSGAGWGGPKGSIKKAFQQSGFNHSSNFSFFSWGNRVKYPVVYDGMPALLKVGKKVKENKSIYVIGGLSSNAEVSGLKYDNSGDFFGLFGIQIGTYVNVRYKVYQLGAGLEHTLPNTKLKLGYGPALYIFKYRYNHGSSNRTMVPGASFAGRLPLGKEKRKLGIELVADVNLAPSAKMKAHHYTYYDGTVDKTELLVPESKISMVHGMAGLAFTFRQK